MADYRLASTDRNYKLVQGENVLGSFSHCQVHLEGKGIAGEHARIDLAGSKLTFTDLGSEAGSFINEEKVTGTARLDVGHVLRVGPLSLTVDEPARAAVALTSPRLRRAGRIALRVAAVLAGVLILAYLILRIVFNEARVKRDVVQAVEQYLNRNATIGSVDLGLLSGHLEFKDIVVQNLPEFSGEPLAQIASVQLDYRSGSFLSHLGKSLSAEIVLRRPVILLERTDRGSWNVDDLVQRILAFSMEAKEEFAAQIPFNELELHFTAADAMIRIRDDLTGRNDEITDVVMEAHLTDLSEPLSFSLSIAIPVAANPGRIEATGDIRLFTGNTISTESVRGRMLTLRIDSLDTRAIPGLPELLARVAGREHSIRTIDTDLEISAQTLSEVSMRGRLDLSRGDSGDRDATRARAQPSSDEEDVTVSFNVLSNLVARQVTRGEISVKGASCKFDAQGRFTPGATGDAILDLDATLSAPAATVLKRLSFGLLREAPIDGNVELRLSTTSADEGLAINVELRADGLACPETNAPPEDVTVAAELTLGLLDWTTPEFVSIQTLTAGASFLHAALGPAEIRGLADLPNSHGRLGLLEVEFDSAELTRRYAPLLPVAIPPATIHTWAKASGKDGRFTSRYSIQSSDGMDLDGTATLRLDEPETPRLQIDARLQGPDAIAATLRGDIALAWPEPGFDISFSASGGLSGLLEIVKPYLRSVGSVWARGKFNLSDITVSGTPKRFATKGKLELLEPELWGGIPTALPFSEPRFDAIWNLEFDFTKRLASMKANVLKGFSSLLQFRLEGTMHDIARGLGQYDMEAFADLDRVGAVLKKLGLASPAADIRGAVNMEISADTIKGDVEVKRLEIDTPFLEAEGGGEMHVLPLGLLMGLGPIAGGNTATGKLSLSAKLNVAEAMAIAPELVPGFVRRDVPDLKGSVKIDLSVEGSGGEVLLSGTLDLDDFVGRLGRHVRKTADELASLRFVVALSSAGDKLAVLRSGILTLGGAASPAKLELTGALERDLSSVSFGIRSESFPIAPIAALGEDLAPGCSGSAAIELKAVGAIKNVSIRPSDLAVTGSMQFRDAELRWRGLPALRTRLSGSVDFKGRELDGRSISVEMLVRRPGRFLPAKAGQVTFDELSVRFDENGRPAGKFAAHASDVDLDLFLASLGAEATILVGESQDEQAGPVDLELVGSLTIERARAFSGRLDFANLGARVSVNRGQLRITDISGTIWGGILSGNADVNLAGRGAIASGTLGVEGIDLARVSKSVSIEGAFVGEIGGQLNWHGSGLTIPEFQRNWTFDIEAQTGEISLTAEHFPLAREVRKALAVVLGGSLPTGAAQSQPVTVRLALRRGRLTLESVAFDFADGLKIGMRGRTELDGRIAGWISVESLPTDLEGIEPSLRSALEELVRRSALRFAVTGTWMQPSVDVKGLLWLLPDVMGDSRDVEEDRPQTVTQPE